MLDRRTIRGAPLARAASRKLRTWSTPSASATGSRNAARAPRSAGAIVSCRARSPTAFSTRDPQWDTLRSSRVKTRTLSPAPRSSSTTSLPTFPVAPVTKYMAVSFRVVPARFPGSAAA
ncbi:hypothetical protein WMF42_20880 [Sorangium sp. So ce176]